MGVSTSVSVSSADTCHVNTVSMLQCRNVAYKKNFVRRRTVTYLLYLLRKGEEGEINKRGRE